MSIDTGKKYFEFRPIKSKYELSIIYPIDSLAIAKRDGSMRLLVDVVWLQHPYMGNGSNFVRANPNPYGSTWPKVKFGNRNPIGFVHKS